MHPECILSVSNCILSVSILSVFPRNEYVVSVPDVLLSFTSISSVLPPILTLTAGDMNSVQLCSKHNHQYLILFTKTSVQKMFLPVNVVKKMNGCCLSVIYAAVQISLVSIFFKKQDHKCLQRLVTAADSFPVAFDWSALHQVKAERKSGSDLT